MFLRVGITEQHGADEIGQFPVVVAGNALESLFQRFFAAAANGSIKPVIFGHSV